MLPVDDIELHDALLKKMEIDYDAKTAKIELDYYESTDDSERKPLLIVFEGVESFSQISNWRRLQKNAFAGNVNYWHPYQKSDETFIYLSDGCIAITASKITALNQ
jgi:hypothetical protein